MIAFVPVLLVSTFAAQSPAADSLRVASRELSDSALVLEARVRPLVLRDAVAELLVASLKGPLRERDGALATASRLAAAHHVAWRDAFLERQVKRFTVATAGWRVAKVRSDSLRRAGAAAYARSGPLSAIGLWRRALARATAIADTVGMAATLGNIGSAWSRLGRLDSASAYLDRSRSLAALVGDVRVEANAVAELAGVSEQRDELSAARAGYARALALRERIGDTRGLAADYNNLGLLAQHVGDLDESRRQFEAALALNQREGREEVAATNLVNLAGLASGRGEFARAESLYLHALSVWRAREQWADAADVRRGLGQLAMRRGNYRAARAELQGALALYDETGLTDDALAVRREIADVFAASGDLQAALLTLRRAQRIADSAVTSPGIRGSIALARADLAAQLNDRVEAQRLYAVASLLFRRAGDRDGEAEAQQGEGLLFLLADDDRRAAPLLDAALRTQTSSGNQRAAAITRIALGQISARRGDAVGARRQLVRAAGELERLGDPVAFAAALGERAELEAVAGYRAAAESLFTAALLAVGERVAPHVTWRLHAGLGGVLRAYGATARAASEMLAGIVDIERAGRSLILAERRSGFLADKWSVYTELALLERDRGHFDAAFHLSERVRARELIELLGQGRIELTDTTPDLVAREQDLRRRIAELTRDAQRTSATGERGPEFSAIGAVTREALLRAQESYADLLLEMRERAPRHAALISSVPPSWRDVARGLESDEAFVEYLVSERTSLAFVVTRDTAVTVDLAIGRHELAKLVDFVRGTLQPRGSSRLDSLWRAPLRTLHAALIAPVEESGLLARKTRLTLAPHAELHYLPFAALIDRATGRYLVERYEIVMTPSAAASMVLEKRESRPATSWALAYAPRPEALPASREEVTALARLSGRTARIAVGREATEEAFRRDAPTSRVIHLATYGVLNKQNPLFSYVELAPGGTEDGRLEVHEVFGMRLTADLVVLSACQTALGSGAISDVPAGDDWVGLVRAFLHAGATRVVASLWVVQDQPTAVLMQPFYQSYERLGAAAALATAQRALLAMPATTHPFYWAGFEVVGAR